MLQYCPINIEEAHGKVMKTGHIANHNICHSEPVAEQFGCFATVAKNLASYLNLKGYPLEKNKVFCQILRSLWSLRMTR